MWDWCGRSATRKWLRSARRGEQRQSETNVSSSLQGADVPHFTLAAVTAGFALIPRFTIAAHVAGQEVVADGAVLGVGGGERRHGAARASARIFPRQARILGAVSEHFSRCLLG